MLTDIEIAQSAKMDHISLVAERIGISADELEFYGKAFRRAFSAP